MLVCMVCGLGCGVSDGNVFNDVLFVEDVFVLIEDMVVLL